MMKSLPIPLLLCALYGLMAAPPGKKEPSGKSEAGVLDPLLQKPWIEADLERTRGELHRLSRLLEKSGSQFPIKDSEGRTFRVDLRGQVTFSPFDGNWKLTVPRRSESALVLAEAEGLLKRGVAEHAVFLFKSVAAMSRLPGAGGALRKDAEQAARRLSELARRESFAALDSASDPFVLYDDTRDETVVISHTHQMRMILPGLWRYQYGVPRGIKGQWRERVLYLGQQDLVLLVGLDAFTHAGIVTRLGGLVDLWDKRRSLGEQRKRSLDFVRGEQPASATFCSAGARGRFSPRRSTGTPRLNEELTRRPERADVPACVLLESTLTRISKAPSTRADSIELFRSGRTLPTSARIRTEYLEFYHLRPARGYFLELQVPVGRADFARDVFGRILRGLSLY